jgi:hypothetical protein
VKLRLLFPTLTLALAACDESSGPSALNGTLSFSYSGAVTGSFSATSSGLVLDPSDAEWAVAVNDATNNQIGIIAIVPGPSDTQDNAVLVFPQRTTGTVSITNGASIAVVFGQPENGNDPTWTCLIHDGSITVAAIAGDRIRGSFAGTGECTADGSAPEAFTLTSGTFDLPLLDPSFVP